jgi:hypothetical protein
MTTKVRCNAPRHIHRRASSGERSNARTAKAVAGFFVFSAGSFSEASPLKASGPGSPQRDPSPDERDASQRGFANVKEAYTVSSSR